MADFRGDTSGSDSIDMQKIIDTIRDTTNKAWILGDEAFNK